MAVDPTSGKLTMYGGWSGYYLQELWTWSDGKWEILPVVPERMRPARPGEPTAPTGGDAVPESAGAERIEN
jgi:hypothetical protein